MSNPFSVNELLNRGEKTQRKQAHVTLNKNAPGATDFIKKNHIDDQKDKLVRWLSSSWRLKLEQLIRWIDRSRYGYILGLLLWFLTLMQLAQVTWLLVEWLQMGEQEVYMLPIEKERKRKAMWSFLVMNAEKIHQEKKVKKVPSIKLYLHGVIELGQGKGFAVMSLPTSKGKSTYGIGDFISAGWQLSHVHTDYVVISNKGNTFTVYLESRVKAENLGLSNTNQQYKNSKQFKTLKRTLIDNPAEFAKKVSLTPKKSRDGKTGFQVSFKEDSAFFKAFGLESGDLIKEIEGQKIGSIVNNTAKQLELMQLHQVEVLVERNGIDQVLVIEIPKG